MFGFGLWHMGIGWTCRSGLADNEAPAAGKPQKPEGGLITIEDWLNQEAGGIWA